MNGKISFQTDHLSYFALLSGAPVTTPPTCSVSMSPSNVQNGANTVVTWSLTNSLTGLLSPGNTPVGISGTLTITPPSNATTTYTISTSNTSGVATCSAQVVATPAPLPGAPSCTLSSSPSAVLNGSGTTLSWNIVNSLTGLLSPMNTIVASSGSIITVP